MAEITHDGKIYVLKSAMENIIKERVSKVATRANGAESRVAELEAKLEENRKSLTSVDLLNSQLTELKSKLESAETRFSRYQSISKHGLTDPDLVDAIEWQFERAQLKLNKKDRISLSDWLERHVTNPEQAPSLLRPHLQKLAPEPTEAPEPSSIPERAPETKQAMPTTPPPNANARSMPAPEVGNWQDSALKDPKLYRQYREKFKQEYESRRKRRS